MTAIRHRLEVTGVVQGVGFRPFVHRLAHESGLVGFVRNDTDHVHIEIEGPPAAVERFEHHLRTDPPPLAQIDDIATLELDRLGDREFSIATSSARRDDLGAVIPADVGMCDDCHHELFDPNDRRYRHPFITCTDCGPRFTIVTSMPYDRANTTMTRFLLCDACRREYDDPDDRRHHAQSVACPDCGPTLRHQVGDRVASGTDEVIALVQIDFAAGRTIAVKGLGGYHLAVDADNDAAVRRLRDRKRRGDKPFAVMVPDLAAARRLAEIGAVELTALESAANPIVLLRARPSAVAPGVAPGSPMIGIMLPSTPLHHLLFAPVPGRPGPVPQALVMTSGNLSEEPISTDDQEALHRLAGLADSFCSHDRPIHTACDDSVVRVVDGRVMPIRRSRGFVPLPITLPRSVDPVLAVGGELKNTFAVARGRTAWLSQHLGDMGNRETLDAFESAAGLFTTAYGMKGAPLAADAHPGYRTHLWAQDRSRHDGSAVVMVQHHHAHLAALMAEHGLTGEQPIAGFVFDGTGHGLDGTSWGGEILIGDYAGFERWGHLTEVRLPGGDSAAANPCRTSLAHLAAADIAWDDDLPPVRATEDAERQVLTRQLEGDSLSVASTSMGRLFDAIASLLDLDHRVDYEAQAAISLEFLATESTAVHRVPFILDAHGTIDSVPAIRATVDAVRSGVDLGAIARGFHHGLTSVMLDSARRIRDERGITTIGLTGGVFQNVLLTELAMDRLGGDGFEVLTHRLVPPNDGGIALGQVMIAGVARGESKCV